LQISTSPQKLTRTHSSSYSCCIYLFIYSVSAVAYLIENDGLLLGESQGFSPFIQYPDSNTETGLGVVQRRRASLSEDPITRETYLELVRRTLVNNSDIENSAAARIAGFEGDVAEGTSVGRYVIRTDRITDDLGLNWTSVVAVSESSLFGIYRSAITQAIVIGLGLAITTCYILHLILHESRKAEIKKAQRLAKHQARQRLFAQTKVRRSKALSKMMIFAKEYKTLKKKYI